MRSKSVDRWVRLVRIKSDTDQRSVIDLADIKIIHKILKIIFELDIIIGSEGQSKSIKISLPPFTLVGATTRSGDLSSPLRDRFGIVCKLNYYTTEELASIIKRTSKIR